MGQTSKADLIATLSDELNLPVREVTQIINTILKSMTDALVRGEGVEIRGFGSFSLHYRPPRSGRNPKTGGSVALPGKYVPHFKPGKELRERVNASMLKEAGES